MATAGNTNALYVDRTPAAGSFNLYERRRLRTALRRRLEERIVEHRRAARRARARGEAERALALEAAAARLAALMRD
ncbi:hypothetical protein [Amphiplicatus metriothermophilus]|uniref:Uncharacterized protein n=1 Tax=Amphiplicatus metriothermophilus TaxID=1519374 RepID=A0A239PJA7_9PROT|nr:hypothetical protein [Amphiplicatus metriothermophilus]MBB5517784.1 hypothetical protein [Amphiplicatus metriothermophilus]SNT67882.1 hypothetical protein SAMN06297382_0375 [Amphiplicatus metriothermophilus]